MRHAGLAEAFHAGRPQILTAFGTDQFDNADRADRLGDAVAPTRRGFRVVPRGRPEVPVVASDRLPHTPPMLRLHGLAFVLGGLLVAGCARGGPSAPSGATVVTPQTLVAGCSMCMFQQEPFQGCFWAVQFEGEHHFLDGPAHPQDHENHGPEGMCAVKREAIVEGWIEGDRLMATRFDLLPFEAGKHEQPAGPAH